MPWRVLIRRVVILLILALLPAVLTALTHPRRPSWQADDPGPGEVRFAQALAWGKDVLWIDARSRASFEKDHLPGARLLTATHWSTDLEAIVNAWAPGKKVVVYCDSRACSVGHETAARLRTEVGLEDVWVLRGGWLTLREARR